MAMRSHYCGLVTEALLGQTVTLSGWVNRRRDHGGVIFIDLRDREGYVQIVCDPDRAEMFKIAEDVRNEFCVQVKGLVRARPEGTTNDNLASGKIEVLCHELNVLSASVTPPFQIDEDNLSETTRLTHRVLDLRRPYMQNNLKLRYKVAMEVRKFLDTQGFIDIETPMLTKSTPEGARDYLVPSRKYLGKFFALPQSPQQYKQMLMVAGMEKYFQIAPCFRDEDARADRSPGEFYQIDMEMSFVKQDDILQLTENMFTAMVKELWPHKKFTFEPWPRLKYREVMEKYGTDKPDLRKDKEDKDELAFAWVVDFPLFTEQTEEDFFQGAGDKWAPSHHMFTAPKEEDIPLLETDPGKVRSYQHDLVLNGWEVGGGSIRIHDANLQRKIFDLIGFTEKDKESFTHLLRAFEFGVPPHGGVAPGFDRLFSILQGEKNIREVIAFPLLADAHDPLMDAPSEVKKEQLEELGIEIKN